MGAALVLEARRIWVFGGQAMGLVVFNLAITFLIPGISIGGHIGGLVGGGLCALAFSSFRRSPMIATLSMAAVGVVSVGLAWRRSPDAVTNPVTRAGLSSAAMRSATGLVAICLLVAAGCGGSDNATLKRDGYSFQPAPVVPDGPLDRDVADAIDRIAASGTCRRLRPRAPGDDRGLGRRPFGVARLDLLRFYQSSRVEEGALVDAFERLTGVDPRDDPLFRGGSWRTVTDHLIAWDTPAPPGYRERKGLLHLGLEPKWAPFFQDVDSDIDWRRVAWGGVLIDDRGLGDPEICFRGCIPALDDPELTPAAQGGWYPDDRVVFGVALGGESVAFPKNIMDVREMVNVTIGGRRLGIPYCTLCASAQAYLTDDVAARFSPLVLHTTGLLQRSNKLMYDLGTTSAIDTFTGRALSRGRSRTPTSSSSR